MHSRQSCASKAAPAMQLSTPTAVWPSAIAFLIFCRPAARHSRSRCSSSTPVGPSLLSVPLPTLAQLGRWQRAADKSQSWGQCILRLHRQTCPRGAFSSKMTVMALQTTPGSVRMLRQQAPTAVQVHRATCRLQRALQRSHRRPQRTVVRAAETPDKQAEKKVCHC